MKPFYERDGVTIFNADCIEAMRQLPDNSISSCLTDSPYGLTDELNITELLAHWLAGDEYEHGKRGFMNAAWDVVPGPPILRDSKAPAEAIGANMNFNEYQNLALKTAIYPWIGDNIVYPVLGLTGESGEVAEVIKKVIRDDGGKLNATTREALKKELGDVLWYVAAICDEAGLDMADIARANLAKLRDRQERNVLHGSGDNR